MTKEALKKAQEFVKKNALAFASQYIMNKKEQKDNAEHLIAMAMNADINKGIKGYAMIFERCKGEVVRTLIVDITPTKRKNRQTGGCWVSLDYEETDTEKYLACYNKKGE